MRKKIALLLLITVIISGYPSTASAQTASDFAVWYKSSLGEFLEVTLDGASRFDCDIVFNGQRCELSLPVLNADDRNYLPMRSLCEDLLGVAVDYDNVNGIAIATSGEKVVEMIAGANIIFVNGEVVAIDPNNSEARVFQRDDRTYIPVRAISEALGCDVFWDGASNAIYITNNGGTANPTQPTTPTPSATPASPTPIPFSNSLKKGMTDKEFNEALVIATNIASKYYGMSRSEQVKGICKDITDIWYNISYSMSAKHYNDVYGYFVLNTASCAGCVRAVGLCLNILGIPYEHVNENGYVHQWARVNVDGVYWVVDANINYAAPEPGAYMHPYMPT